MVIKIKFSDFVLFSYFFLMMLHLVKLVARAEQKKQMIAYFRLYLY